MAIHKGYDLLKDVYLLMDDGDRFFLKHYGITPTQYYALLWLEGTDRKPLGQLSKDILTDPGNVTRLTDRMENKGWVKRERDKNDRRVNWVSLTPQGRQLCEKVRQAHEDHIQSEMNILSSDEQIQLQELLQKLRTGLRKQLHADA